MAHSWHIKKAAVEQVIEFPNKESFSNWADNLCSRKKTYEIVRSKEWADGKIDAVVRIPYNNNLYPDGYF